MEISVIGTPNNVTIGPVTTIVVISVRIQAGSSYLTDYLSRCKHYAPRVKIGKGNRLVLTAVGEQTEARGRTTRKGSLLAYTYADFEWTVIKIEAITIEPAPTIGFDPSTRQVIRQ